MTQRQDQAVAAWQHQIVDGDSPTLLLLHGTGGDEHSLIDLAHQIAPGARLVGVAGRSTEEGVRRYFRRFDALRYDQDHLAAEADALADFVGAAPEVYGWSDGPVIALGYSNGANLAVALMLRKPGALAGAALLRPVQPLEEPPQVSLAGTSVLVLRGEHDPYGAAGEPLAGLLLSRGAAVEAHVLNAGHGLVAEDLAQLSAWFSRAPWREGEA